MVTVPHSAASEAAGIADTPLPAPALRFTLLREHPLVFRVVRPFGNGEHTHTLSPPERKTSATRCGVSAAAA